MKRRSHKNVSNTGPPVTDTQSNNAAHAHWTPLAPPDFLLDRQQLVSGFVERQVRLCGSMAVPASPHWTGSTTPTRAQLMRLVDTGFATGQLSSMQSGATDSCLSVCARDLRLSRFPTDQPGPSQLRVSTEHIRSISYVRDGAVHYVLLVHGDPASLVISSDNKSSNNNLLMSVLQTDTRIRAEEICSLVSQCFQVLYTEATMQHLTQRQSAPPASAAGSLEDGNRDIESVYSDLSSTQEDCLQNFMNKLQRYLSKEEMKCFHTALSDLHKDGGSTTHFCGEMKQLLGPSRISLLIGMKSFVSHNDWSVIDNCICELTNDARRQQQLSEASVMEGGGNGSLAAATLSSKFCTQRSLSYASTSNGAMSIYDEENHEFHESSSSPRRIASGTVPKSQSSDFSKAIDQLFTKVGDLELILSNQK